MTNGKLRPSISRSDVCSEINESDYSDLELRGGIMISRRPNMRASSEYAPGPSPMMVRSMVRPNISDVLESKRVGAHTGTSENPRPTAPAAMTAPIIGVRKPIISKPPVTNADRPINKVADVEFASLM